MPSPHRIVFLDRSTVKATFRAPTFEHTWAEHEETLETEVVERAAGATMIITNKVPLSASTLARLPALQLVAVAATGVDIVDLPSCRARGITVSNIRRYAMSAVPEHAMMLMLALRRNLLAYRDDVARGAWAHARTFCLFGKEIGDLAGATLGIIGAGALGQATAALARAFGMQVIVAEHKGATSTRPDRVSFDEALRTSDVISLHAALTTSTRHLISTAELRAMKSSAILINTARGALVDEAALATAIEEGWIAGAGIDVLAEEPPRRGSPLLDKLDRPNLIVTPHVAWASRQAMQTLADQVIDNLEGYVRGAPRNVVP